jgi:hypothetical protein
MGDAEECLGIGDGEDNGEWAMGNAHGGLLEQCLKCLDNAV